jgi:Skp family chaperone for outer membrane proteins
MVTILTIDLRAVLDRSETGRDAANRLREKYGQHDGRDGLAAQRAAMCQALLRRAHRVLAVIAKRREAVVVDRRSLVLAHRAEDVTAEVIRRVDALGPLRKRRSKRTGTGS